MGVKDKIGEKGTEQANNYEEEVVKVVGGRAAVANWRPGGWWRPVDVVLPIR